MASSELDELFAAFKAPQDGRRKFVSESDPNLEPKKKKTKNIEKGVPIEEVENAVRDIPVHSTPSGGRESEISVEVPAEEATLIVEKGEKPETSDATLASKVIGRVETSDGITLETYKTAVPIEELNSSATIYSELSKGCIHQCMVPAGYKGRQTSHPMPIKPAKTFSYPLDPFQASAVECLEAGESVLVAAHTSAGKTTVAEYAIGMALRDHQRIIYTSPIKALSNQKYRDLAETFSDVGLMTGDVTLNPSASIVILTTEILRSILYRGSELIREVRWIVFDEIHYMRDKERGVVWEETIVLLPDTVRSVFLSATIPNALEFAEWIARIKKQPCHVISTHYRPTPLQHFVFPSGGDAIIQIMDEKRNFNHENFRRALQCLDSGSSLLAPSDIHRPTGKLKNRKKKKFSGARGGTDPNDDDEREASDVAKLVKLCTERHWAPAIVFGFSKSNIEGLAVSMRKLDLTNKEEKEQITEIFESALNSLADEDKKLTQILGILPLLQNGIGIHHGGLLPIAKEVTELLFQESLVKVLFSTETFAMGVNMPAKTVIFSEISKFDGESRRILSPGEYVQMSGRAGRRGLDARGFSIVVLPEDFEDADEGQKLFSGEPLRLDSAFSLKYNSILNLMRVEGANPQYMMKRSFLQFQDDKQLHALEESKIRKEAEVREAFKLESMLKGVYRRIPGIKREAWSSILPGDLAERFAAGDFDYVEEKWSSWYRTLSEIKELKGFVKEKAFASELIGKFLQVGRVVHIVDGNEDWGIGIVTKSIRKRQTSDAASNNRSDWFFDVLLETSANSAQKPDLKPAVGRKSFVFIDKFGNNAVDINNVVAEGNGEGRDGDASRKGNNISDDDESWEVVPCTLKALEAVSCLCVSKLPAGDLTNIEFRKSLGLIVKKARKIRESGKLEMLDPIKDIQVVDAEGVGKALAKIVDLEKSLHVSPFWDNIFGVAFHDQIKWKFEEESVLRQMEAELMTRRHPKLASDLQAMRQVLWHLGYVDNDGIVTLKGRVACDVSSADELMASEILFENLLEDLSPEYIAAMLSCLVFDEGKSLSSDNGSSSNSSGGDLSDPILRKILVKVKDCARRIAEESVRCRLSNFDPVAYLNKFDGRMMQVVLKWMRGARFAELISDGEIFEGTVVRVIRRLEELCREMAVACKIAGIYTLETKFRMACTGLRRGIIFAASLYL